MSDAKDPPPLVDSTGFMRSIAESQISCPHCVRLLAELCRVSYELGKAQGELEMLRGPKR